MDVNPFTFYGVATNMFVVFKCHIFISIRSMYIVGIFRKPTYFFKTQINFRFYAEKGKKRKLGEQIHQVRNESDVELFD